MLASFADGQFYLAGTRRGARAERNNISTQPYRCKHSGAVAKDSLLTRAHTPHGFHYSFGVDQSFKHSATSQGAFVAKFRGARLPRGIATHTQDGAGCRVWVEMRVE